MFLRLTLIISVLRAHCQHEGWEWNGAGVNSGVNELACLMWAGGAELLSHGVSAGEAWQSHHTFL